MLISNRLELYLGVHLIKLIGFCFGQGCHTRMETWLPDCFGYERIAHIPTQPIWLSFVTITIVSFKTYVALD